jgi:glycosyltransferase involved in cell wall biosynthesis
VPAARIALVHDFLLDLRGGERVFLEMCEMWPEADIFTTVYDESGTEGRFAGRSVTSSFLQHLRPTAKTFRAFLPLYPAAIQSLDFSGYDVVVSSSSAWAHGVRCGEGTVHLSYCHNPFRYAWNERDATLEQRGWPSRALLREFFERWRRWDQAVARRTDRYVANAETTQRRLREHFHRDARIIYPPVQTERFSPGAVGDHHAVVGELMPHKQIDVAIAAFNQLHLPLMIVGDGPDYRRLRRIAGPTITFTGRVSDAEVAEIMSSAQALVVTAVEEFGIVAVEGQAAGRPVLARGEGGALETVIDGVTGCHWTGGPGALAAAVRRCADLTFDPQTCVANAERFDRATFRLGLRTEVAEAEATVRSSDPVTPSQPLLVSR